MKHLKFKAANNFRFKILENNIFYSITHFYPFIRQCDILAHKIKSFCDLGVTFDEKLPFVTCIQNVINGYKTLKISDTLYLPSIY